MANKSIVAGVFVVIISVLASMIFLAGSAREVSAVYICWPGESTIGGVWVASKNYVHQEYLCNQKNTKDLCVLCGECMWADTGFPNSNNKCHVSTAGFTCGMLLNQSECLNQSSAPNGCTWNATASICQYRSDGAACTMAVLNPEAQQNSGICPNYFNYNCNDAGYGNSNTNLYVAASCTHIGHDIFCEDRDNDGLYAPKIYLNDGVSPAGGLSCTQGPGIHNIYPRVPNNNCTCVSNTNGANIVNPLVCLATDNLFNYDCPPGYHLPTIQCCAGDQPVNMDKGYNQTCDSNFCSKLSVAQCSNYASVCQVQTSAEYGFCGAPNNAQGYVVCSTKYTESSCVTTTYSGNTNCTWKPLYNRCVKKQGATIAQAVNGVCGTCSSFNTGSHYFEIRNSSNGVLLRVDQTGTMWIRGTLGDTLEYPVYGPHDFLIKNSAGQVKAWVSAGSGSLFVPGGVSAIITNVAPGANPTGSGNFVIRNNTGANNMWIDSNGYFHLKGCFGQGKIMVPAPPPPPQGGS